MAGGGVGMAAVQEPLGLYLFGGLLPGLGFAAASHIVAAVLLARWFKSRLGLATGIMSSAVPGGQALFVPFAVALIPLLGWRTTYLLLGLLIAVGSLPLLWSLAREPRAASRPLAASRSPQRRVGRDVWLLGAGYFGCGFTDQMVTVHFIALAAETGVEPLLAAGLFSLMLLSGVAGSVLSGPLADTWPPKRLLSACYLLRIVSLPALLLAGPGERLWILSVFAVVFGATYNAHQAPGTRLIRDGYGVGAVGHLMGSVGMVHQVGGAIGVAVGGASVATTGNYGLAILLATAISALAMLSQQFILTKNEPRRS
jgi:predicted MFS family arabinose efflux permease